MDFTAAHATDFTNEPIGGSGKEWRTAIGMTPRRERFRLHVRRRRVNHHQQRHTNQDWARRGIGVRLKVPRTRHAMLLVGEGLVIVRMRRRKRDRDAEVKQRQRQAENLVTHG